MTDLAKSRGVPSGSRNTETMADDSADRRALQDVLAREWLAEEEQFGRNRYSGGRDALAIVAAGRRPGVVLTSPHAVTHLRDGHVKKADRGTGGLVCALAKRAGCWAVAVAHGPAEDAAWTDDHALKRTVLGLAPRPTTLVDIHGMTDQRDLDVEIGLGHAPSPSSTSFGAALACNLEEAGLAVAVQEKYLAPRATMLTNWSLANGFEHSVQIELAARVRPPDAEPATYGRLALALWEMLCAGTTQSAT